MSEGTDNIRAAAIGAMQTLLSGLEGRLVRQRVLPHPGEGALYDLDANKVSRRSFLHGDISPAGAGELVRRESVGLLHRPMLGAYTVKICVAIDFGFGNGERFTPEAVNDFARWSLAHLRSDIFFILAIAGMNHTPDDPISDDALRALTGGTNWRAAFVEFINPGWRVTAPKDGVILPALFENLFDPEPQDQKIARIDAALVAANELREPGGFVLIDDLARRAAVSTQLVTDRAMMYAGRTPGLEVKDVDGSLIIQRSRFNKTEIQNAKFKIQN